MASFNSLLSASETHPFYGHNDPFYSLLIWMQSFPKCHLVRYVQILGGPVFWADVTVGSVSIGCYYCALLLDVTFGNPIGRGSSHDFNNLLIRPFLNKSAMWDFGVMDMMLRGPVVARYLPGDGFIAIFAFSMRLLSL